MKIDFIFDLASPNAYFCHKVLPKFEEENNVSVDYFPCLLGGIFKSTSNQPPWGLIAGRFKYSSQQAGKIINGYIIFLFKFWQHLMTKVCIWACQIKYKINFHV